MTEYAVTIALKRVEVSAGSADEAVVKAAKRIVDDLPTNTASVTVALLDRITVPGFKRA